VENRGFFATMVSVAPEDQVVGEDAPAAIAWYGI
jgi:hypothetical protein